VELLADRENGAGKPRERRTELLALHSGAEANLLARRLGGTSAWLFPPIAKRFGGRLAWLGWPCDDTLTPSCKILKARS